tara:strand:- start:407 stop:571 length:165 start_codon:yes stop_codon:yes gene_type:complete
MKIAKMSWHLQTAELCGHKTPSSLATIAVEMSKRSLQQLSGIVKKVKTNKNQNP